MRSNQKEVARFGLIKNGNPRHVCLRGACGSIAAILLDDLTAKFVSISQYDWKSLPRSSPPPLFTSSWDKIVRRDSKRKVGKFINSSALFTSDIAGLRRKTH